MVRVMMPVGRSEEATLSAATDLAAQIAPALREFVPE
jgi:hypothetical protein